MNYRFEKYVSDLLLVIALVGCLTLPGCSQPDSTVIKPTEEFLQEQEAVMDVYDNQEDGYKDQ